MKNPPWIHKTLELLAAALGVTTRTLENWRARGCPVPEKGPHDELAVRLWHVAQQFERSTINEIAAAKSPLDVYLAHLTPLIEKHRAATTGAGDLLKRKQIQKLDTAIDSIRERHISEAKRHFVICIRQMERLLLRDLGSEAARLHKLSQEPLAIAEPAIKRHLHHIVTRCLYELLGINQAKPPALAPVKP